MKLPEEIAATIRYDEHDMRTYIMPVISQAIERMTKEAAGVVFSFAALAEAINKIGDDMRTGAVCGPKPVSAKFYREESELLARRNWRACKRAFTQTKWDRLPRGQRA